MVLTELTPLTSYSISVAAVNENGDIGVFSEPVTTTTPNCCKNLKPALLFFFSFKANSCTSAPIIVGVIIGLVGIAVGVSGLIGGTAIARKKRYTS